MITFYLISQDVNTSHLGGTQFNVQSVIVNQHRVVSSEGGRRLPFQTKFNRYGRGYLYPANIKTDQKLSSPFPELLKTISDGL